MRASQHKKEEKERIRQELLGATLRLAGAHGFASLGLREVSREAGIAPTSFYRHFADMEELGLALIRERVRPVFERVGKRSARARSHGSDVAEVLVEGLSEALDGEPELLRFVLAERHGASAAFRAELRDMLDGLSRALLAVPAGRTLPPAAELAVTAALQGCDRRLDGDEGASPLNSQDALLGVLRWLLSGATKEGAHP